MRTPKKPQNTSYTIDFTVDDTFESEFFLKLRLRVCHDGLSPNKTHFTKDIMEKANDTLQYRPILANVILDENGKPVFGSHDTHTEDDKLNEGETKEIYDETPIGLIPSSAENNWSIEEFDGKNYTFVDAYIWREYSNYAEQIIENAVDTKLSMEISIPVESWSYNAKEKYWDIKSYKYRGITLLNPDLGTGMKNALATTENFSENSELKDRMIILMEQLEDCLRDYNKSENTKGGHEFMTIEEIEALLGTFSKTVEDIDFDTKGMSKEDLETKLQELFGEVDGNEPEGTEPESTEPEGGEPDTDPEDPTPEPESPEEGETFTSKNCTFDEKGNMTLEFKLSHDDIRCGLNKLIEPFKNDQEWCWVEEVYDDYFVMIDWDSNKLYKQSYVKEGDNLSLVGERIPVFNILVTESEKLAIEEMQANYSLIQESLEKYKSAEELLEKEAIFLDESYSEFLEEKDFVDLKNDMASYTVEQLRDKAELTFAKLVKKKGSFTITQKDEPKDKSKVSISYKEDEKEYKPYGDLFD